MFTRKTQQNGYPKRMLSSFALSVFLASFVSGLFLLESFREYRGEALLLVFAKSEKGAIEVDAATDALLAFSQSRDFLFEASEEMGDYETLRSGDLVLEKTGKPILRLSFSSDDPITAEESARDLSLRLFSFASRYYDVRSDLDFRIVEISTKDGIVSKWEFVLASIASGICVASLFFGGVLLFAKMRFSRTQWPRELQEDVRPQSKKNPLTSIQASPVVSFPKDHFVPKKPEEGMFPFDLPVAKTKEEQFDYGHFHRGPAPENLPMISEEDALNMFVASKEEGDLTTEVEPETKQEVPRSIEGREEGSKKDTDQDMNREPTDEEYKRRLNELLSGKMPK